MLTPEQFTQAATASIPRFSKRWLNDAQAQSVFADKFPAVFIVAGPGTGKTTVLALRVLKLILIDGIQPESVLATTFTRKAAEELRSRLLSWGYAIVGHLIDSARKSGDGALASRLSRLDINQIKVGTLDSLSEDFIRDNRRTGTITPATAEGLLTRMAVRDGVLFKNGRFRSTSFDGSLRFAFGLSASELVTFNKKVDLCSSFFDRLRHDRVNMGKLRKEGAPWTELTDAFDDYRQFLDEGTLADFSDLETRLLELAQSSEPAPTLDRVEAVLVDEFQDTNLLQENIYYAICKRNGAALTVVGDDDQSIYRFRGATVEIFANFHQRCADALGQKWTPRRTDLVDNYRSTRQIVSLCSDLTSRDESYSQARVSNKPPLRWDVEHTRDDFPVLGLFRETAEELAEEIASLLESVFRGTGFVVNCADKPRTVIRAATGGFGDAVLLSHSVREIKNARERLPLHLRRKLGARHVEVFNPRGRELFNVQDVATLLGLALECIDPHAAVQGSIPTLARDATAQFTAWRTAAQGLLSRNPDPKGLPEFVRQWQDRKNDLEWPDEWPLLELIFTLVTWFPRLQRDPEGQVYLEAITRTVAEVGQLASFRAQILTGQKEDLDDKSVKDAIREVFESIALGVIDVDEEIMPYVPRTTFPVMTIHQAKGLEFPLVIVDVGSDFSKNNWKQEPVRAPKERSLAGVHLLEDKLAPFSPVGKARTRRPALSRAWDDLRRLYYVAMSRPHNVLLLVGLTSLLNGRIQAVQTGDTLQSGRVLNFVPAQSWSPDGSANSVALI